jgi:hypothetical protein
MGKELEYIINYRERERERERDPDLMWRGGVVPSELELELELARLHLSRPSQSKPPSFFVMFAGFGL